MQFGEVACALADEDEKEAIEEEVVLLQDEFDSYVESLSKTKNLLEVLTIYKLICCTAYNCKNIKYICMIPDISLLGFYFYFSIDRHY